MASLGGFNFGIVYSAGWRDTHVRLVGDVVHDLEDAFAGLWNRRRAGNVPGVSLPDRKRAWNPATVLRVNDPALGLFPVRAMFLAPLDRAKERIYLTSVYFIPSRAIKEGLMDAAGRGVDVRVLVPKRSTYAVADRLARRHFDELLGAGVRIFEYDERYVIHSKSATVDGVWSTVGSANLDSLSLFGLHETNLEVYSRRFAEQIEEMFGMDEAVSEEVTLEKWQNRPPPRQVRRGRAGPDQALRLMPWLAPRTSVEAYRALGTRGTAGERTGPRSDYPRAIPYPRGSISVAAKTPAVADERRSPSARRARTPPGCRRTGSSGPACRGARGPAGATGSATPRLTASETVSFRERGVRRVEKLEATDLGSDGFSCRGLRRRGKP
ncbi:MAG: phospholipase D-like domain-containing protein [Actinomycetota bacterium]|nr:phospholipase D-like domain-containing protein [Actinomycetota bacterium]